MGVEMSLPQARLWAPTAYLINFGVQMYGMQSKPNMLDIHYRRPGAFSPWPYAIPIFFTVQQGIQISWLLSLFANKTSDTARKAQLRYAPIYTLGNVCIAAWLVVWNKDRLDLSFVPVAINSLSQLYHVAFVLPPRSPATNLTHLNAKTFAGIGLLDFVHNGAAAFFTYQNPSLLVQAATGVLTVLGVGASDWIMGGCIAYDLAALAIGQSLGGQTSWATLLAALSAGSAVASFLKYRG